MRSVRGRNRCSNPNWHTTKTDFDATDNLSDWLRFFTTLDILLFLTQRKNCFPSVRLVENGMPTKSIQQLSCARSSRMSLRTIQETPTTAFEPMTLLL